MHVVSVNAGRPQLVGYGGETFTTAINKRPIEGPVEVGSTGIATDQQAHTRVHGGPQLALCVYPGEHYVYFEQRLGRELPVPSFGENLTTRGWLEAEACIGDVCRIGSVLVQISQPREPCATLTRKHREPRLARWVHETGYSGFYLRVLGPGDLAMGDAIQLVDRPHEGLTVALAMQAMFADPPVTNLLMRFVESEGLSPKWRRRMAKRLAGHF